MVEDVHILGIEPMLDKNTAAEASNNFHDQLLYSAM